MIGSGSPRSYLSCDDAGLALLEQLVGGGVALVIVLALYPGIGPAVADDVVGPHDGADRDRHGAGAAHPRT